MDKALDATWGRLWDLANEVFDREGQVNDVLSKMTSAGGPPPTRADLAESAALLCQLIKQAIAVTESLAAQMGRDVH